MLNDKALKNLCLKAVKARTDWPLMRALFEFVIVKKRPTGGKTLLYSQLYKATPSRYSFPILMCSTLGCLLLLIFFVPSNAESYSVEVKGRLICGDNDNVDPSLPTAVLLLSRGPGCRAEVVGYSHYLPQFSLGSFQTSVTVILLPPPLRPASRSLGPLSQ